MSYTITTMIYEYRRFITGVIAVAFSLVLILIQGGLLVGLFAVTSWPVDYSSADIWVGAPSVLSVDVGSPIPQSYISRLNQPEIAQVEILNLAFSFWTKPNGGSELCIVVGSRLETGALGALKQLTPELRTLLQEPGTVVVDRSDLKRLGVQQVGETAQIMGHRVRIVGISEGVRSMAGPLVFCSIDTARPLLRLSNDQTMYILAKCHRPEDASKVVEQLKQYETMSSFTTEQFSLRTRMHWLTMTKGGIAIGYAASLGLLVGAMITSQTLYSATLASLKEYAVLWALGISRKRVAQCIMEQTFCVGIIGILLGLPVSFALAAGAEYLGAPVTINWWMIIIGVVVIMYMTLLAGLAALRSLRLIEPSVLLR
ncbi:MAG TPA: ABC transporter permease [Gemmatales bacterium]|nr:ABC transporter permease [Gemmatales bacterium]